MVESSDARDVAVAHLIAGVLAGESVESHEGQMLDCKEDPSRRGPGGVPRNGNPRSDDLAKTAADAIACFANSEGGAVVVGIDDKATGTEALRGTDCDSAWLQNRIRQLVATDVSVSEQTVENVRIVVIIVDPSSVPIADTSGRYRRRQGRDCQTMTGAVLGQFSVDRQRPDWSSALSASTFEEADPIAVRHLREWLRESGEASREDLANLDNRSLLHQLGLSDSDGRLNRAGELLRVRLRGREPLVDFIFRPAPGADTELRIDHAEAPLAELLAEIEAAIAGRNPVYLLPGRLSIGQIRALPELALREALMNAAAHRDWSSPEPIRVQLEGVTLTVTNPGGFLPGVTAETVITAPPRTRNHQLARSLRGLRLAESEGIGVDRMFRETVRQGLPTPDINELPDGSGVRCVLFGGPPDSAVIGVVGSLPQSDGQDVDILLILHELLSKATVSATQLSPVIQKSQAQAIAALGRGVSAGLIVPSSQSGFYRLSDEYRTALMKKLPYMRRSEADHAIVIGDLLAAQGEIRARDLIDACGVSAVHASRILTQAVQSGLIERHGAVGAGVFYTLVTV